MARSLPGEGDPGSEKPRRGALSAGRPERREPEAGEEHQASGELGRGAPGAAGGRTGPRKEACGALRVMTFDDDIRVPFGHAHDHAKMIVQENGGLKVLIEAAKGRSRCSKREESGFRTASSMVGSRHQSCLPLRSHLRGSPNRTRSLPLVFPGEFQASDHWPGPHPVLSSRTI